MARTKRPFSGCGLTAVILTAIVAAGCGTRLSRDEIVAGAALDAQATDSTAVPQLSGAAPDAASASPAPSATAPDQPVAFGRAPGSGARPKAFSPDVVPDVSGGGTSRTHSGAVRGGTDRDGGGARDARPAPGQPARTTASSGGSKPQAVSSPPSEKKSPVIFANVGTHSGVGGGTLFPIVQGAQVWVKHINSRGGLNGHPVKLLLFDDGGDPARHRALVQEAIERHKAIAFLGNTEVLAGRSSVDYINEQRVPVVGIDTGEPWAYESPMYFPQASSGDALNYTFIASIADQMASRGKTKLGMVVCVEAQVCTDAERVFAESAPKLGIEIVYRAKASLTQPDFTAECLAARNAGAEVFYVMLTTNTVYRVATSCSRQGYNPTFATASALVADGMKDEAYFDGMLAMNQVFPYFQSGTAATDEYQEAMRVHGRNVPLGAGPPLGWTAGKLMERAAANLPEPPTSAAILAGLWSIKGDTLGGITQPLTFVEGKPAVPVSCWFNMTVRNKSWVSPDGFQLHCRER